MAGDCTYYAFSFESLVFRRILRFLSNDVFAGSSDPAEARFTVDEAHQQIEIWIEQLGGVFEESWLEILHKLTKTTELATHVHSPKFKYDCLLLPERQKEIERTVFAHDLLNKTFKFDRLKVDWSANSI